MTTMARTRTLVSIVFVFGFLVAMSGVAFSTIQQQVFTISSFSGTVDSVDIFVNGHGMMPTGPITLGLDPHTANSTTLTGDPFFGQWDFAFGITLDVPLFDQLGLGGDTVYITETGPYSGDGLGNYAGQLSGGGVSALFKIPVIIIYNNWHFNSSTTLGSWFDDPGGLQITIPASPIFDPNNPQTVFSQGSGTFSTVPEPTTLFLVGSGLVGLLSRRKWFTAGSPR